MSTNGQLAINRTITTLPTNGTNEVQTLTIGGTPTAGSMKFTWNGNTSIAATWSATNATLIANIQAALDGLFNSGGTSAANCIATAGTVSSGIGTVLITFRGGYATGPQALLAAVSSLTGTVPTAVITRTTTGVQASNRMAPMGSLLTFTGMNCINEIQTLTIGGTPTGTFTITGATAQNPQQALTTAAITWSATNGTLLSNLQSALDTTFGTNNVIAALGTITSGVGTITLAFSNSFAFAAMTLFTATGLTTGTTAIALTTAGGTASSRTGNALVFRNLSSTLFSPNWQPDGSNQFINLGNPAVGSSAAVHAAVTDTGSTIHITTAITNPDFPRAILLTPGGTTANVTATTCDITGTDCNDNPLFETTPPFTAGQATAVTTVNAFKTVTAIDQRTTGASVTIAYGTTTKVGLGALLSMSGALDTVRTGWDTVISTGVATIEATRPVGVPSTTLSRNLVSFTTALATTSNKTVQFVPGL